MKYHIPEVRVMLKESAQLYSNEPIRNKEDAIRILAKEFEMSDREVILAINVDTKMRPLNYTVVAIGIDDRCITDMKSIFRAAILSGAKGILLLHNHPSGSLTASQEDISLTERIIKAGKTIDIRCMDHIIFSAVGCRSLREDGVLSFE